MLIILWRLCLLALACRSKVLARLSRRFRGPADALKFFESPPESRSLPSPRPVLHHRDASTQAGLCAGDISTQMKTLLGTLPQSEQAGVVCDLMQSLAPPAVTVPPEFIAQSLTSMQRLQQAGRSNILAGLAKALGTMRPDGSDSLMPVSRMPVGLIEYAASFFSSDSLYQVQKYKGKCIYVQNTQL